MSEFTDTLNQVKDFLKSAYESAQVKLDRASYMQLVDYLKDEDPNTVKIAIDQLVAEKNKLAIAPLYAVAHGHPVAWVRSQAEQGLNRMVAPDELAQTIKDKNLPQAVAALIDRYGHYKT